MRNWKMFHFMITRKIIIIFLFPKKDLWENETYTLPWLLVFSMMKSIFTYSVPNLLATYNDTYFQKTSFATKIFMSLPSIGNVLVCCSPLYDFCKPGRLLWIACMLEREPLINIYTIYAPLAHKFRRKINVHFFADSGRRRGEIVIDQ